MSICPKNKCSKARRDSRRANWKMGAVQPGKVQQVRRADDASSGLQGLRKLQQARDRSSRGLMACVRDTLYAEITEIFEKENFLKASVFLRKGNFWMEYHQKHIGHFC